jgi:superfamily I DNA/RNA helicase
MKRNIVIGPPGTGKTTFLKNKVDKLINGGHCRPDEIGYFSFTVKAAEEIRDRVTKEEWSEDELKKMYPYFCTLHSLAYKRLQLQQSQIMDQHDYDDLSRLTGRVFVNKMKKGNGVDISMPLEQMDLDLKNFKRDRDKLEYVDYFNHFLERRNPPKLKYLFVDEAQDLSVHQWKVIDMIQEVAQPIETYVAGDDDQAIFRWAGADIEHFIAMATNDEHNIIPLTQSYRIPKSVHSIATNLAQAISRRIPKEYAPRDEEGERKVLNIRPLNKGIAEGEWLILCRTHEIVQQVSESLETYGWLYKRYGQSVINLKYIEAIKAWTTLQNGKSISGLLCDVVYQFMDSSRIKRNYGTFKGDHAEFFTLDDLITDYGLRQTINDMDVKELKWYDVLNAKGLRKRINYLRKIMREGNKLDDKPRIEVSTIHASKGGERDNVMLLTDLSYGPYKSSTETQQGRDDEARVFYVGMTRAKKKLVIVRRTDAQFEYEPIFFHERKAS